MFDMLEIFFINERFDQICLWLNRKKEMWNSYHQICFHFSKENCSWRNLFVFFLVWNLFFCFCDHFNERIWLDLSATACSRCIHFIERMLSIVTFFLISFSFFVFFSGERVCWHVFFDMVEFHWFFFLGIYIHILVHSHSSSRRRGSARLRAHKTFRTSLLFFFSLTAIDRFVW